jgi:MFS family permease
MKKKIYYGWYIVAATNIICMIGFGTWLYCFGVFFKPMSQDFGWTRAETAFAYSFRGIQGGVAGPVVGWAADKYGSRIVIFCGALIAGFGFVMMYFINSLWGFYIIYGILLSVGMSAMLYIPAMTAIANWFIRMRSRALSLLAVGAAIGGFVCAPAATFLINRYSWRISFVIIGVAIWIIALPLSLIIKRKPEDIGLLPDGGPPPVLADVQKKNAKKAKPAAPERDWTLKEAMTSKTYWLLAFAFFLAAMTHATVTTHSVNALTDAGVSDMKAATIFGTAILFSIVGRLTFGWLGDFFNKRYLYMITYSIEAAGVLVLMNSQFTNATLFLFIALFGIGFGGTIPLNPAIRGEYFGRAAFGKIQGFMAPVTMLGSVAGPPLVGHLFDVQNTYKTGFFIIALLQFLAALTILFARPAKPPEQKMSELLVPK